MTLCPTDYTVGLDETGQGTHSEEKLETFLVVFICVILFPFLFSTLTTRMVSCSLYLLFMFETMQIPSFEVEKKAVYHCDTNVQEAGTQSSRGLRILRCKAWKKDKL